MELQPPKIRWQDILHRSIRARYAECAGKVDYSRTRFSKRQAVYSACATAFGGKMAVMPSLCAPKPRVCIGVDTSGSMGKGDLLDAVSEANGVIKAIGSEVTFLACDAEIHGEPRVVNSTSELVNGLRGGGGTDFRPLFEAVENLRHPVDVFIFLTDGMGPAPDVEPMGFKTIWVLIGSNAVEPCSWGTHVRTE
jgi:predicted metal-dependent peptidase